jgi:hypothetical protein
MKTYRARLQVLVVLLTPWANTAAQQIEVKPPSFVVLPQACLHLQPATTGHSHDCPGIPAHVHYLIAGVDLQQRHATYHGVLRCFPVFMRSVSNSNSSS